MDLYNLILKNAFLKMVVNGALITIIDIYVDNMIITVCDIEIFSMINKIKRKFKISKCEPINYILGIKIDKVKN